MAREWLVTRGVRERVPLWIGLYGPSGSGKTFSALRLGAGIVRVRGGALYVIDTEGRRALHYADNFEFQHMDFGAPFGSLDYLAAVESCKGAGCIVIDSFSHEHEGAGGLLDAHDTELDRIAGASEAARYRANFTAWARPKAAHRHMVQRFGQIRSSLVCCFRARERNTLLKTAGKTEVVAEGWQPIGGTDLVYEMTVNAYLPPRSGGVPDWKPEKESERAMIKLPKWAEPCFAASRPLDEDHGAWLANWAGGASATAPGVEKEAPPGAPVGTRLDIDPETGELQDPFPGDAIPEDADVMWNRRLAEAAVQGTDALRRAWEVCPAGLKATLKPTLDAKHKLVAVKFDALRMSNV